MLPQVPPVLLLLPAQIAGSSLPWANVLTGARALLAPVCAWCCWQQNWVAAAILFTLAALSDYYDGPLARARGTPSPWGGLFDHATDAWFVSITLAACAMGGWVTVWLAPLVIAAFVQYTLDSRALAGAALRANWLGRSNGIAYYVLTGIVIGFGILAPILADLVALSALQTLTVVLSWVLVVTTAVSMGNRLQTWIALRRGG